MQEPAEIAKNEGSAVAAPSDSKPSRKVGIELIVAAVLGILALAFFIGQEVSVGAHTTATETFLFNCLQFLLTMGFTWFSTRAISRLEFEQSLKRFAISAYRRIADIDRMVDRLRREIREMISQTPTDALTNLRAVDAMVSDTAQIVRSSISDWGDVIGEELLAIERIRRLENEKALLRDEEFTKRDSEVERTRKKLEETIAALQRTLPPRLQLANDSESRMTVPPDRLGRWLARNHRGQNGLPVRIVTGDIYRSERPRETLRVGELLRTDKNEDGSLDVVDEHGLGVGRLTNSTPANYDDFVRGFEYCYGDAPASLEFIGLGKERRFSSGRWSADINAKVVTQPLSRQAGGPTKAD